MWTQKLINHFPYGLNLTYAVAAFVWLCGAIAITLFLCVIFGSFAREKIRPASDGNKPPASRVIPVLMAVAWISCGLLLALGFHWDQQRRNLGLSLQARAASEVNDLFLLTDSSEAAATIAARRVDLLETGFHGPLPPPTPPVSMRQAEKAVLAAMPPDTTPSIAGETPGQALSRRFLDQAGRGPLPPTLASLLAAEFKPLRKLWPPALVWLAGVVCFIVLFRSAATPLASLRARSHLPSARHGLAVPGILLLLFWPLAAVGVIVASVAEAPVDTASTEMAENIRRLHARDSAELAKNSALYQWLANRADQLATARGWPVVTPAVREKFLAAARTTPKARATAIPPGAGTDPADFHFSLAVTELLATAGYITPDGPVSAPEIHDRLISSLDASGIPYEKIHSTGTSATLQFTITLAAGTKN